MSRGLGRFQLVVLEQVELLSPNCSAESLRWSLYERQNSGALSENKKLPIAWQTKCTRSFKNLVSRGLLKIKPRWLVSFDELVIHFPGKTLVPQVRRLRQQLLPLLLEWSKSTAAPALKYGEEKNEKFFSERATDEQLRSLTTKWQVLESALLPVLAMAGDDRLLRLICKGRSFFNLGGAEVPESLLKLLEEGGNVAGIESELAGHLQDFGNELFPRSAVGKLKMKSLIHTFSKVPGEGVSGPCHLRKETLNFLHQHAAQQVESLPGFKPKSLPWNPFPTHSPLLHTILDRTAFQKFRFLYNS